MGALALVYGVVCHLMFLAVFLYLIEMHPKSWTDLTSGFCDQRGVSRLWT